MKHTVGFACPVRWIDLLWNWIPVMPVTRFTSMSGCSRSILSRWWRVFWVTTLVGLILSVLFCVPVVAAVNKSKAVMAHAHAVEAKNGYAGSESCAACHLEIYQHYKETG